MLFVLLCWVGEVEGGVTIVTNHSNHYFHSSSLARLCWTQESSKSGKIDARSWGSPREVRMLDALINSFPVLEEAESWDFFFLSASPVLS